MSEKIIRDPVHDVIAFRTDHPVEALLFRLLNAAEFQRLRRIRQLGLAALAYPGADHSRYSHSLGVMETARKMLHRLGQFFPLDPHQHAVCLVAALLHDVGHGPFSHVFERVTSVHHEHLTQRVIHDPDSELHQILTSHDPSLPDRIISFLQCQPLSSTGNHPLSTINSSPSARTFYNDILASQLDADRCDYLLRDNLMTGSQYGGYDLGWLLQALTLDPAGDRLAISSKGISAIEDYLQARYHMYRNVYFHKVVRSAEGMIRLALQRARRLAVQDRLPWPPREHAVYKALLGQTLTNAEFTDLDDVSMLHCFKIWSASEDATLVQLCRGLLYRRLYKVIDLSHLQDLSVAREAFRTAEEAVERAGADPAYDLFFDEPANTPYSPQGTYANHAPPASDRDPDLAGFCPDDGILIRDARTGAITEFSRTSPLVGALNRQLLFRRIHVHEPLKPLVLSAIAKYL